MVSCFGLAIHISIILHHSRIRIIYFEETQTRIWRLPFAVNASLNLSPILNVRAPVVWEGCTIVRKLWSHQVVVKAPTKEETLWRKHSSPYLSPFVRTWNICCENICSVFVLFFCLLFVCLFFHKHFVAATNVSCARKRWFIDSFSISFLLTVWTDFYPQGPVTRFPRPPLPAVCRKRSLSFLDPSLRWPLVSSLRPGVLSWRRFHKYPT